jgi:hypothetical protein
MQSLQGWICPDKMRRTLLEFSGTANRMGIKVISLTDQKRRPRTRKGRNFKMDWVTILTSIGGAAAAAWLAARFSVKHAQKQFSTEHSKAEIIKAIELAETYANRFVPLLSPICTAYKRNAELVSLLKRLDDRREQCGRLEFTYDEMEYVFSKPEIDRVREIMKSVLRENANKELQTKIRTLLNGLEYFAMYFNTKAAHSATVYQSLHQTFFSVLVFLYFDISHLNKSPKDLYYTNVIELFNDWNAVYISQHRAEEDIIEDTKRTIKAIEDETHAKLRSVSKKTIPYKDADAISKM